MQHAMMRAAEAELRQHFVRIADKVAIGEEQKLDEIEIGLAAGRPQARPRRARNVLGSLMLMSAI